MSTPSRIAQNPVSPEEHVASDSNPPITAQTFRYDRPLIHSQLQAVLERERQLRKDFEAATTIELLVTHVSHTSSQIKLTIHPSDALALEASIFFGDFARITDLSVSHHYSDGLVSLDGHKPVSFLVFNPCLPVNADKPFEIFKFAFSLSLPKPQPLLLLFGLDAQYSLRSRRDNSIYCSLAYPLSEKVLCRELFFSDSDLYYFELSFGFGAVSRMLRVLTPWTILAMMLVSLGLSTLFSQGSTVSEVIKLASGIAPLITLLLGLEQGQLTSDFRIHNKEAASYWYVTLLGVLYFFVSLINPTDRTVDCIILAIGLIILSTVIFGARLFTYGLHHGYRCDSCSRPIPLKHGWMLEPVSRRTLCRKCKNSL